MCVTPNNIFVGGIGKKKQVLSDIQFFYILTCEGDPRHSCVQFFDLRTSKIAPRPSIF